MTMSDSTATPLNCSSCEVKSADCGGNYRSPKPRARIASNKSWTKSHQPIKQATRGNHGNSLATRPRQMPFSRQLGLQNKRIPRPCSTALLPHSVNGWKQTPVLKMPLQPKDSMVFQQTQNLI